MKIGALEAGGTKMVLGIFSEEGKMIEQKALPTLDPAQTVPEMQQYFAHHQIDALGIGSFGPLDLDPASSTYGWITSTPKLAWQNYPLLPALLGEQNIPCAIDTDVNTAVLAELKKGAAEGLTDAVYITIGTGIGGGICVGEQLVHGLLHPEVGHILLRPHPDDANPKGVCPYHEGCLEGLASGPAIRARTGENAENLAEDHPAFNIEAYYLAQMCVNLILITSPQRIILGGGVMNRKNLFEKVRSETVRLLGGYVQHRSIVEKIEEYIVPPRLYPVSGLIGAYLLGLNAYHAQKL